MLVLTFPFSKYVMHNMKKKWGIVCNWVYLYGHKTIGSSWKNVNKLKLDHQPWVCVKLGNGFEWKLCQAPTRWPTNHINGHYWPTARKQSQGSFSIQVTTFWSKICFWCQDSPHSDVYFATNSSSQKKNCCVRCEINYIYYTLQITQLQKTCILCTENTQIYVQKQIFWSKHGAIIFHFPLS